MKSNDGVEFQRSSDINRRELLEVGASAVAFGITHLWETCSPQIER